MSGQNRVLQVRPTGEESKSAPSLEGATATCDVETVHTPDAALERLEADAFDCVFTFDRLEEGDGLEVLSRVRDIEPTIPVVLYAVDGSEQLAAEAISAGVSEYIPGPSVGEESDLKDQIQAAIDRTGSKRALAAEREVFVQGPAVIFKWRDEEGWPIEYVSENVEDVLGYTAAELESGSTTYADLVHEEDLTHLEEEARKYTEGELDRLGHDPYRVRRKDGSVRWVIEHTRTIEDPQLGEDVLFGYVIDITKRRKRELELQQFREAVEQTAHAVYITDPDGTIEYVNPAFETVTGYGSEAVRGETPQILQSGEHDTEFYDDFWTTISSGDTVETEMINERADGEEIVLHQTVSPIHDEDGNVRKFVAVAQDVTEIKEYERQLERQRDNLEVLNQVVRHDIRNELQLVNAYVEAALSTEADREQNLKRARSATRDAVEITDTARDVMEVMLQPTVERTPQQLRDVLLSQVADLRTRYEDITVTVDGPLPDLEVLADDMLGAVFRNLLSNAVQHNDTNQPKISVSADVADEAAVVEIADNGPGIPESQTERIFQKGETGLESDGTGLGLHLVKTLLRRYDGAITITENEPSGARFVVRLPLAS